MQEYMPLLQRNHWWIPPTTTKGHGKEWKAWINENDALKLYIATMESTTTSLGFEVVSISIYINSGLQS
jgi:hypothetical protein